MLKLKTGLHKTKPDISGESTENLHSVSSVERRRQKILTRKTSTNNRHNHNQVSRKSSRQLSRKSSSAVKSGWHAWGHFILSRDYESRLTTSIKA